MAKGEELVMTFWDAFWPQLIATLIGVGLGIPAGIWLNHLIESRTEKEKKKKILNLLGVELTWNKGVLSSWKNRQSGDFEHGTLGSRLIYETWKAFSEGGELKWVKDPSILFRLSNAYSNIKVIEKYSEKYYNLTMLDSRGITQNTIEKMYIRLDLAVDRCTDNIDRVIEML